MTPTELAALLRECYVAFSNAVDELGDIDEIDPITWLMAWKEHVEKPILDALKKNI